MVVGRKTHWLDEIGKELWEEVRGYSDSAKSALSGDVPVGQIEKTMEEQLADYLGSTPEQLEMMMQTVGPEMFGQYVTEMKSLATEQLGPLMDNFKAFNEDAW